MILVIVAVIITGLMFYSTYHLSMGFKQLTDASEEQIELRKAARELMDASDYLTENAQRFTIAGDTSFMDAYFNEAFVANHREEAISRMSVGAEDSAALQKLKEAMNVSLELMSQEYYAMRLVLEAKEITDYPEVLQSVTLTAEDAALSAEEKMQRATELLLSEEYYSQKELVRENMRASLDELEQMAYDTDAASLDEFGQEITRARVIIVIQIVGILFIVWLTSRLGIRPVLEAVERIKANDEIEEVGANEFRYLVRAYNKMFELYKSSLARLNYKASHDELTGAYNRAGYELLLSTLDLPETYMLLFDVDNFKRINDSLGHEAGDKALRRVVRVLKQCFRAEDHVCRIGGDEVVVLMNHVPQKQPDIVRAKLEEIRRELAVVQDELPPITVSAGIVHGSDAADTSTLFEKADAAMYRSKQKGKNTYTFV